MKSRDYLKFTALTGCGLIAVGALPALAVETAAKDDMPVVIVTAQKRATNVQKTPLAITVLDSNQLSQQGKPTLEDALRTVTGITVQADNNSATYTIRGIRPSYQTDPAVNVNRDGIFQSNDGVTPNFDVARIEVLKGPQGTLYGRNAVGGVVNIVNNDPKPQTGGYISASGGNYNAIRVEGAVNLPLSDKLYSRTSVYTNRHDGYLSNGNDDDNTFAVRQKLKFMPTEQLTFNLLAEYDHTDAHGLGTVYAPLASHTDGDDYYSALEQGAVRNTKSAVNGSMDYDLGGAVLTAIASYYRVSLHSDSDLQGQGLQAVLNSGKQTTQEIRLSSPSTSRLVWLLGLYHLNYYQDQNQYADPLASGTRAANITGTYDDPVTTVDSSAVFGQMTYPLTDSFRLTGGLRYTQDRKTQITGTYSTTDRSLISLTEKQKVQQSAVTWKFGGEYDLSGNSMLYADVSKGFKSGGLNQLGVPSGYETYDPEELIAYAIGSKNRLFSGRVQFNSDLFYYDYSSKQFQAVQSRVGTFPLLVTFNGAAKVYGAETQIDWRPTQADRLGVGVGYTYTEITAFNYPDYVSRLGQPLENAPRWSGSAHYEHVFHIGENGELSAGATVYFQSGTDTVTDDVEDDYQTGYQKYDLSISYRNLIHDYTITFYGANLTDVTTRSRGYARPYGITADTLTLDPPRTFGISLNKKF